MDGGVTLTGGEVMMQYAFVKQLLARCKAQAIHTAIETSGYAPEAHYLSVLPDVDWIFTDIKHMDARQHLAATGVSNELILNNIRSIAANRRRDTGMVVRIPIITGFNDNEENASATADFVKSIGLSEINILPFHRLGSSKYEQLDLPYRAETLVAPQQETMERLSSCIQARGIQCYIGSNTPF